MITFFKTPQQSIIATESNHPLTAAEVEKLCWLYGGATLEKEENLTGQYIGPRREMITPWSTNAVEITQNMAIEGITRIEEYFPAPSPDPSPEEEGSTASESLPPRGEVGGVLFDPMLQRLYQGLDQGIFTINKQPDPIISIENLEEYNEQEGLALSPEEIEYLHKVEGQLGRKLTDSEVFGFAQINSEHCRHKIFGGTFIIDGEEKESSLFQMIKKTTQENPHHIISAYKDNVAFAEGPVVEQFAPKDHSTSDWFEVRDIESVISIKAETHNFPTTVEPFNGASTGTGGEIRDRMGGGTGSWPIAGTAVYMTAYPRRNEELRMKNEESAAALNPTQDGARDKDRTTAEANSSLFTLHSSFAPSMKARKWLYQTPEQILIKASNGASDFGNKFGQPLICGSVLTFEHQEKPHPLPLSEERGEKGVANSAKDAPLLGEGSGERLYAYDKVIMLAGGVGYGTKRDCLKKEPQKGNKVVVVGGDNYRIGLGGGSVSSVETGRYSSGIELNAVQRANPEMQKRANNLVRALCEEEVNPVVSIHDHGSAGHVNCLSELVEECGGLIDMTKLPIGDPTLSAKEIIANESQERMGLLIDEKHIEHVRQIAERERAPLYVVGETTGDAHFAFQQGDGKRPFDLDVAQMFGHSPKTIMRDKTVEHKYAPVEYQKDLEHLEHLELLEYLERVLSLEAVACKDWLTNKVDRSVTGKVARQQCQGELQLPLSDCGVVALDYRGVKGIATALGHAPQAALADPAAGSVLSVAESLTNILWAPLEEGLDSVSLSANWMWPCRAQEGEDARLYQAVEALSDFCCALQINVPTGKDSLSMTQKYPDGTKVIAPGTVIVSSGGLVSDIKKVVSPVIQNCPSTLYHIDFSFDELRLGGSAFAQSMGKVGSDVPTVRDPEYFRDAFNAVQDLIKRGLILAGHDISAGGLVTCLLEMCFANTKGGLEINLNKIKCDDLVKVLFAENPGIVIQVADKNRTEVKKLLEDAGVGYVNIGRPCSERHILVQKGEATFKLDIDSLRDVWFRTSYLLDQKQSFSGKAKERYENLGKQPLKWQMPKGFTGKLSQYNLNPDRWKIENSKLKIENRAVDNLQTPKAAIIREKGTNGEREMAYMLYLAGFDVKDVMMTDLISGRETLDEVNFIVFCGGFSNSDVLGSAKGWAGAFLYNPKAKEALDRFYARPDTLSLGVCNGCQLMVELGLIHNSQFTIHNEGSSETIMNYELRIKNSARMLHNDSHKFESNFVGLTVQPNKSVLLESLSGSKLGIWVAHGEGKFHLPGKEEDYNIVLKYSYDGYPANPNGSDFSAAGIVSADGRHLAMMPHLERAFFPWQCGFYPAERQQEDQVTPWIEAFVNAREWIKQHASQ